MPLINIEIPAEDGWRDDVASRVLFAAVGIVTLILGLRLWAAVEPEGVVAAIPTFLTFAVAIQLFVFMIADIELRDHGRTIGYAVLATFAFIAAVLMWQSSPDEFPVRLGTDALAFTVYGTNLALEGINPMTISMAPALDLPGATETATYHVDGSLVDDWSYPGGLVWVFAPQFVTIGHGPVGGRLTTVIAAVGLGVSMLRALPPIYAPAALLAIAAPRNIFATAVGGLIDVFWVLPTVVALLLWYQDRSVLSAGVLGVACAMKQQPTFIVPFLAIWLWHERDSLTEFARLGSACAAVGGGAFLALNLPFIISDPAAWVTSVFTPLGGSDAPLESVGVGLAAFKSAGLDLPRWLFRLCTAVMGVGAFAAYWRWFEQLRWAAWIAPAIILFFAPRSLPSYVNTVVPLVMLALFAVHGRLAVPRRRSSEVTT